MSSLCFFKKKCPSRLPLLKDISQIDIGLQAGNYFLSAPEPGSLSPCLGLLIPHFTSSQPGLDFAAKHLKLSVTSDPVPQPCGPLQAPTTSLSPLGPGAVWVLWARGLWNWPAQSRKFLRPGLWPHWWEAPVPAAGEVAVGTPGGLSLCSSWQPQWQPRRLAPSSHLTCPSSPLLLLPRCPAVSTMSPRLCLGSSRLQVAIVSTLLLSEG